MAKGADMEDCSEEDILTATTTVASMAAARELARGLANYSSAETRLIARKPSTQIEPSLGYVNEPELIHRTNLVLSQAEPG